MVYSLSFTGLFINTGSKQRREIKYLWGSDLIDIKENSNSAYGKIMKQLRKTEELRHKIKLLIWLCISTFNNIFWWVHNGEYLTSGF